MSKYKILFIDEDAQEEIDFHYAFDEYFEVQTIVPERTITFEELMEMVLASKMDILIIDYRMRDILGFDGTRIVNELKKKNSFFPALIATSDVGNALDHCEDPTIACGKDIWHERDDRPDEFATFIKLIHKMIELYVEKEKTINKQLNEYKDRIAKQEVLSTQEESDFAELNNASEDFSWAADSHTPKILYYVGTNKRFDELIRKTDELISKINNS